jgi:hypothetical protein
LIKTIWHIDTCTLEGRNYGCISTEADRATPTMHSYEGWVQGGSSSDNFEHLKLQWMHSDLSRWSDVLLPSLFIQCLYFVDQILAYNPGRAQICCMHMKRVFCHIQLFNSSYATTGSIIYYSLGSIYDKWFNIIIKTLSS